MLSDALSRRHGGPSQILFFFSFFLFDKVFIFCFCFALLLPEVWLCNFPHYCIWKLYLIIVIMYIFMLYSFMPHLFIHWLCHAPHYCIWKLYLIIVIIYDFYVLFIYASFTYSFCTYQGFEEKSRIP